VLADTHRWLGARVGPQVAVERLVGVLVALERLGRTLPTGTVPDRELDRLTRHLAVPGLSQCWSGRVSGSSTGHERSWQHLGEEDGERLRTAYAEMLAEKVAQNRPPERLAPPPLGPSPSSTLRVEGGCLLCGVGTVEVSAIRIQREGGRDFASRAVWTERTVAVDQLGPSGPERVKGHLCPACLGAVERGHSMGPTAHSTALVAHLQSVGSAEAERLRDEDPVTGAQEALNGVRTYGGIWYAARRAGRPEPAPNPTPWAHMMRRRKRP